jgi:hypothetical protein
VVSHAGLLRASGIQEGTEIDVRIATGEAADKDGGVPNGEILRRYAEAILDRSQDVAKARAACIERLGDDATVQAASIVASFDGINRVADATGIRLDPETAQGGAEKIIRDLGLEELGAARA